MKSRTPSATSSAATSTSKPDHYTSANGGGFQNPWDSAQPPTWSELVSNPFPVGWARSYAHPHQNIPVDDLEFVRPDWGIGRGDDEGDVVIKATWLGHASAVVELPRTAAKDKTVKVLFDPIFSLRAGPTQYTGPKRILPAPCQVKDLPGCDFVCISHNQ